jgi:hypothetical protein
MTIDMYQGRDEQDRKFGYVCGDEGGFFFTWMPTLEETLASVEEDEMDGDGGLDEADVVEFLRGKIAKKFAKYEIQFLGYEPNSIAIPIQEEEDNPFENVDLFEANEVLANAINGGDADDNGWIAGDAGGEEFQVRLIE